MVKFAAGNFGADEIRESLHKELRAGRNDEMVERFDGCLRAYIVGDVKLPKRSQC